MYDPSLFDLLNKSRNKNLKSSFLSVQTAQKDRFDLNFEEAIKEQINYIIENESTLPPNKLLTESLRRSQLEHQIREEASFTDFRKNLSLAIKILQDEGQQYFEKAEFEALFANLDEINQRLDSLDLKDLNDEAMQAAVIIPPSCGRSILKVSIDKYEKSLFDESLAIFILLTIVNPLEPDYWFRLGLVAQKCENLTLALSALGAASELAPEFIGAHIYASYCHLKLNSKENALAELAEARKIQKSTQIEKKWQQPIADVENLLALVPS